MKLFVSVESVHTYSSADIRRRLAIDQTSSPVADNGVGALHQWATAITL